MSVRLLKTFCVVVREGSFAAAADKLALTQSAISLQMKALEQELRVELFDRSQRRPTLNEKGRALLERATEIIRLYEGLGEAISDVEDLVGTLSIGAISTVATGILPDALARLAAAHPRLKVRVVHALSAELMTMVDTGNIDAAIVSCPPGELPLDLTWHAVADEPLVVIAPDTVGEGSDEALLSNFPVIRFNRHAWAGRVIESELKRRKIITQDVMELDSIESIALMVGRGLGVAIVPYRTIAEPFPLPLTVVPFGEPPVLRQVGVISRTARALPRAADELIASLRAVAAENDANLRLKFSSRSA
ncbi:MAG: LysR family transcriptional regulator [Hyphomicrobiaceae bacterium]|nr:MAG: LysR family transcriptional regulator [Hyphomicrobiaceae bacterium]